MEWSGRASALPCLLVTTFSAGPRCGPRSASAALEKCAWWTADVNRARDLLRPLLRRHLRPNNLRLLPPRRVDRRLQALTRTM